MRAPSPFATAPEAVPLSLGEQLIHSTVRLKTRPAGATAWSSIGTGFYWNSILGNGFEFSAIVTNRHVLADAGEVAIQLHERSPTGGPLRGPGREVIISHPELVIVSHNDPSVDLALIAFGPTLNRLEPKPFFRSLTEFELPDLATIETLNAAQEIFMVGYPNGLADEMNNAPIIRRGTTAVPAWLDYEGRRELLCDVPVFGGSSGSPIFVVFDGVRHQRDGTITFGTRKVFLLGVLYAGHVLNAEGEIISEPPMMTHVVTQQTINLGLCVKAERVEELVLRARGQFGLPV